MAYIRIAFCPLVILKFSKFGASFNGCSIFSNTLIDKGKSEVL